MRPSKAKDEFSEAGTCRAHDENKPQAKFEVSANGTRTLNETEQSEGRI